MTGDKPDPADTAAFLARLDPTPGAWHFRTFAPDGRAAKRDGTLAEHAAWLAAQNAAGHGVFTVVNAGGQTAKAIDRVRAVFADFDTVQAEPDFTGTLQPHIVVESSPGKWHAYYCVTGLAVEQFEGVQRAIAARFGSDPNIHDLPRVMRLPGFRHLKGAEPFPTRIARLHASPNYTAEQILAAFPPLAKPATAPEPREADDTTHGYVLNLAYVQVRGGASKEDALATLTALCAAKESEGHRHIPHDEIVRAVDGAVTKYPPYAHAADVGFGGQPLPAGATPVAPAPRFKLTPAAELLRTPKPLAWLLGGVLLPGTSSMLVGDPSAGKSLVVIDWAACIALGREWHGRRCTQGLVVYLAGEGQHGIARRLKAWELDNRANLSAAPLVVSDRGASLNEPAALHEVIQAIDAAAQEYGPPVLIVSDTLHRNLAGDENSAKDTAAYFQAVDTLRTRFGAHVLTVHHSGHGDKERARGSSSLRGAVDTELLLTVNTRDEIRTLTTPKQKDGPKPPPAYFQLKEIDLPWLTDDGEQETSVVLMAASAPAGSARTLTPGQRRALDALAACDGDGDIPLETWRAKFYETSTADSPEAKKKAFQRARGDLVACGAVTCRNDRYAIVPNVDPARAATLHAAEVFGVGHTVH